MVLKNEQKIPLTPGQFVYTYREEGQQIGMCDQCFRAGRFSGLTSDEIAYFAEEFEAEPESDDRA